MALDLIYITNRAEIALIAQTYGVNRIMVDLETLGKEERQKGMNTVKSHHTVADIKTVSQVLDQSETMVRVNPWNSNSSEEIDAVIAAGADRIMLPMWKSAGEVDAFLREVNRRVRTTLLLETKEAVECLDAVLENPLLDEIHVGLNDLHLSYDLTFMFELLADGTVEALCKKCAEKKIPYGFGGIARLGGGMLPAERIVMEHYRLGSTRVILSRTFCNTDEIKDLEEIRTVFAENVKQLRIYEDSLVAKREADYQENIVAIKGCVDEIVRTIKEKRAK